MLYHLITSIKVGDTFARALRIIYIIMIYGINGVVPIPASGPTTTPAVEVTGTIDN